MIELGRAPIYSPWWERRRWNQVRIPDPELRKFINLMLQDPFPFFITIFDTADTSGPTAGAPLGAFLSAENRFTTTEDFWWYGTVASFSQGTPGTNSPFSFQLFHTQNVGEENEVGNLHSQKPVNAENFFGTAQKPFYLKSPKLFHRNTEVLCNVANSQAVANAIQIVLLGYLGEPAGGLT